jgi:hypothetical protein
MDGTAGGDIAVTGRGVHRVRKLWVAIRESQYAYFLTFQAELTRPQRVDHVTLYLANPLECYLVY